MKIVLAALHFANLRNYESVVQTLVERGHQVHLVADEAESLGGQALVERLAAGSPLVTWSLAPSMAGEPWFSFAQKVRYALDYVRFLAPRYQDVPKLRIRNVERAPRLVRWASGGVLGMLVSHRVLTRLLMWLERHMPRSEDIERLLAEHRPDVLVLTTLTFSRSSHLEQLKAARALGIRTVASILSWDHLSSKALLHLPPDLTLVWNEVQKHEAVDMHGLDPARVLVTGAQCYDQWFTREPSRSREEYCAALGLDPARRIVLWVCSTMSPAPEPVEPVFVRRWVEALRASLDPALREASIVVRPHPERRREWAGVTLDDLDHVVLHGRSPIDADAKADYFDALYYADAVVGLCTSAFLEAAIVGRPVLTLLLPEYRMHQDGMAHFRYLLTVGGGLLHTASDLPAHLEQLAGAVRGRGARDARNRRFIEAFVRPSGLTSPATPVFVEALERLAREPSPAAAPVGQGAAARSVVAWLAASSRGGILGWLMMDRIDEQRRQSEDDSLRQKHEIVSAREAERRAKAARTDEALREKAKQRRAKSWARWRRGLNAKKQVAQLKRSVKHVMGAGER